MGKKIRPKASSPSLESNYNINLGLLAAVCLLVFYPLFMRGLYFDKQMAVNFIFTAVLAAAVITIKMKKRDYLALLTPLDIAVFLYFIAYLLSMVKAIHIGNAAWGCLKALDYFLIYILVSEVIPDIKAIRTIFHTLLAAGVGVAGIGLLAAAGYSDYPGAFVNNHIMSTLQYHNTTAAFLGAMCFIGFALLLTTETKYRKLIYSGAIFLMAIVAITAISKGALLIIVMAAGLFFWNAPGHNKWIYLLDLVYIFFLAFLFSSLFMRQINAGQGFKGLIIVGIGICLTLIGQSLVNKLSLRNWNDWDKYSKKAGLTILIILIASAGLLMTPAGESIMPPELSQEIKEIVDFSDPSYIYRADFIRWGTDIARDHPLTGAGAGGWKALLPQYQDYKYTAADAHNHMIQVLVETGILGLLIFLAIWVLAIMAVIKFRQMGRERLEANHDSAAIILLGGAAAGAAGIGLHALIDFDLSIPAIFIVLVTLLAIINRITGPTDKQQQNSPVQSGILGIMALILLLAGVSLTIGTAYAENAVGQLKAIENDPDFYVQHRETALNSLLKAVTFDPLNAENQINLSKCYASLYIDLARQEKPEAAEVYKETLLAVEKAEKLMPYDTRTVNGALNSVVTIGNLEHSLRLARKIVVIEPNMSSSYEVLGEVLYGAARYYLLTGDLDKGKEYIAELQDLPIVIQKRQENMNQERLASRMGRSLKVTPGLASIIEESSEVLLDKAVRQGGN